jgi:hypothetical protein
LRSAIACGGRWQTLAGEAERSEPGWRSARPRTPIRRLSLAVGEEAVVRALSSLHLPERADPHTVFRSSSGRPPLWDSCFSECEAVYCEEYVHTLKTLKPGQAGTKGLLARYGASLLCVRYRYDEITRQRLKTVELIVQRRSRPAAHVRPTAPSVAVHVAWRETDLRRRVKAAGGRWDPAARLWVLRRDQVERLGLLDRVVRSGSG